MPLDFAPDSLPLSVSRPIPTRPSNSRLSRSSPRTAPMYGARLVLQDAQRTPFDAQVDALRLRRTP